MLAELNRAVQEDVVEAVVIGDDPSGFGLLTLRFEFGRGLLKSVTLAK